VSPEPETIAAAAPDRALKTLADQLRAEQTVISPHVAEVAQPPALGLLAAACPRAARAPADYALVVESVREGYLLHYGEARLLTGHDTDLALLAGDYLYARGIERLAALGDAESVRELGDLISLSAECHAEGRAEIVPSLWLASTLVVGAGGDPAHEAAKQSARRLDPGAARMLGEVTRSRAESLGVIGELDRAAKAIDFRAPDWT
jgi:hypothetical protein